MKSADIRSRFLTFFKKRGHTIIPSASLVTSDEKGITNTTLFNSAGMQPLVPYLLGKEHPSGTRLVDSQKCLRTIDLDEVGDKTHATFFEMLGNWSLGDYFKKEAITWSYEFLTSKEEGLGLDPPRLYVTVFAGDQNSTKDDEAATIWKSVGVPEHRIYFKAADSNWWPAVKGKDTWTGPTGPCSEMFYDITPEGLGDLAPNEFFKSEDEQKIVEIWNDVFMEFEKKDGVITGKLAKKNVDTGAGLERLATVLQKVDNIYDTDMFKDIMLITQGAAPNLRSRRIIADHMRAACFLISDGVVPSNTDRGYVLRRLIRRAVINTTLKELSEKNIADIVGCVIEVYGETYPEIKNKYPTIVNVLKTEVAKFASALEMGTKEFEKLAKQGDVNGADAFKLFSSFGLPIDLLIDLGKEFNVKIDTAGFDAEFVKHQELSRSGAEKKFKGGLSGTGEMEVRYHTATHLLHQALRDVLGTEVGQKGSNITTERLRFDFSFPRKMTDDEKKKVEQIINEKIRGHLPMNNVILPRDEAEKTGALHFFGEKYGDEISVYYIGPSLDTAYSKEFCGGPHVKNTAELAGPTGLWTFKIAKEEAVSQGVRRIKAVLS